MNSSDHFINAAIIGVPFDFDRRTTIEFDRNHGEWFVGEILASDSLMHITILSKQEKEQQSIWYR